MKTKILALLFVLVQSSLRADTRENQLPYVPALNGNDGVRVLAGGAYTSRNITVQNLANVIASLLFGSVVTPWGTITASVDIEGFGNHHGLMVHTSGLQGNAIIGFSQSGGCAGKYYQDTYATCSALFVGRDSVGLSPILSGTAPMFGGAQKAGLTMPLIDFWEGTSEFRVASDGSIYTTGAITNGVGGTPQVLVVSGSASVTVPSLGALGSTTVMITVPGATITNTPTVEISGGAALPANIVIADKYVSGANTVTVKFQNVGTSNSTAGSVTVFRAKVTQF
jgi:hypothetical protein